MFNCITSSRNCRIITCWRYLKCQQQAEDPQVWLYQPAKTIALGVVGGLVGIYLLPFAGPVLGPLFAALGAVAAIIWGADAIRRVASYGLGTGVPSIGYMSLAIGIVGGLAGIAGGLMFGSSLAILGPIMGFVIAMIVGAIVALIGKKVVEMKIPVSGTVYS